MPRSPTATRSAPTIAASSRRARGAASAAPRDARLAMKTNRGRQMRKRMRCKKGGLRSALLWLPHAVAAEGVGSVVGGRALQREVIHRVFVIETDGEVAAVLEVGVDFEGAPEGLRFVVVDAVGLGDAPELAAAVVLVGGENLPAIFVDVEGAAGVEVGGAGFEGGLDDPDAVQFVAGEILVDVQGL